MMWHLDHPLVSHRIHVWYIYIAIFVFLFDVNMVNLMVDIPVPWILSVYRPYFLGRMGSGDYTPGLDTDHILRKGC